MQKSLITTPIYYVNDIPHIGHAYTTLIADTLKKYYTLQGEEVFFLTGTDEHGQKIEQSARLRNQSPKAYADSISAIFKNQWDFFNLDYDGFIRTTDSEHQKCVQNAFEIMFEKGDIYKGTYSGYYCVSCESYCAVSKVDNTDSKVLCPDCLRETTLLEEESYFFKLSAYEKPLLEFYAKNPEAILPIYRKNEVTSFIEQGLLDLSITRTSFEWGIPLPKKMNDPKHVVYVWLDALLNYASALGYLNGLDNKMAHFERARHIVGKDILRFHAIYWPAFLMSLNLPLFKQLCVHGWWTIEGVKMSKSLGNVLDAQKLAMEYGIEELRYFLLREVPFGQDGDFSKKALVERINANLNNDLGNLLNRLLGMAKKYFNYSLKSAKITAYYPKELEKAHQILDNANSFVPKMQLHKALEELFNIYDFLNKLIAKEEPWVLHKNNESEKLEALLSLIANVLLQSSFLLYAFMPKSAMKLANAFRVEITPNNYERFFKAKKLQDMVLQDTEPLFCKMEKVEKASPEKAPLKENQEKEKKDEKEKAPPTQENYISIEDFKKVEIKVGLIKEAQRIEKSNKLLRLKVDLGENRLRQIISGIALDYEPESLVGQMVCVVANLKPAKLMGEMSEGMILAVRDSDNLALISPTKEKIAGSLIS
ncbi:methionine--tRNA ligase [Helicobacter pylori]|uniref:Methionine--tRNA ligase n=1 Tax=Helicobacter pylori Hp P-4 TaxID=992075 RepID=I9W8P2_HELPX|nr:methionine--tRNA ligase [Helicobacter pylori]EJC02342.1 methionine--tRNA ligase, beta subunit [Helicobacter pylori Hp P-4]EJC22979.1 methionine--tRNA ligase, beta subunit [Helicobacter pylori Hp P-4d]